MANRSPSTPGSGLRRFSSTRFQTVGVLLVSLLAVLAAFLKVVIGLEAHKGWDWVGFFQDVAQFAFIGAIVTAVSARINALALRRQHEALIFRGLSVVLIAFHGPSARIFRVSPSDTSERQREFLKVANDITGQTERTLPELAKWLSELTKQDDDGTGPPAQTSSHSMLSGAATNAFLAKATNLLWNEFYNGITQSHNHLNLRGQRKIMLSYLVDDLAPITSANSELAAAAIRVRDCAEEYLALIQQTDAAIEHDFLLNSKSSQLGWTNSAADKTYHVNLAALSSVSDRVAYLMAYCDERFSKADGSEIKNLVPLLVSSFQALAAELWAAGDLIQAYRSLTVQAVGPRTRPRQWITPRRDRSPHG